ncbi:MAG TPA: GNAT family N-acetyltransferase [Solirubrobacteraceae bacterium]|nr:GNAT family N-acetyltransferase [Solirubrobacteraceae bacterium]
MPPTDWTIRSATSADIAAVLSLWTAAAVPPGVSDTPTGLAALLGRDGEALLVAASQGALAGCLIAAWDGWRGSFYRLAVHPDRRREGIGTALLRAGERRLERRGALRLTAIVAEDDALARAFWDSAGYERQPNRVRFLRHLERSDAG